MECLECGNELEISDTTYSNVNTDRVYEGQHTGNIYYCENCKIHWIDDFITGKIERWSY